MTLLVVPLLNQQALCATCRFLELRSVPEHRNEGRELSINLRCKAVSITPGVVVGRALECSGYVLERRTMRELAWR